MKIAALTLSLLLATPALAAPPKPADAKAFAEKLNRDLHRLRARAETAEFIKNTYITVDSEANAAAMQEDVMAYLSGAIKESLRFKGLKLDPETARFLYLARVSSALPAPGDAAKRQELAETAARLEGMYGKGKHCKPDGTCRDLQQLSAVLSSSRDPAELQDAWTAWHSISVPMKPLYQRLVALSNEGAREIGFQDLGDAWKAGYDVTSGEFEQETDRLWQQVKPLYDQLHCYVRAKLRAKYGDAVVPAKGPIPAHLLGNMWAQEWASLYPLAEPYPGQSSLDVDAALKAKGYDAVRLVKLGEAFFTSVGLQPLPATFWERSQFTKPKDREVVCHASAWDTTFAGDVRIKMCIQVNEEDLITVHHELGHIYYYLAYYTRPMLHQSGANDGFHEAIGDALTLSITPKYLKDIGLLDAVPADEKGLINVQMKSALERIAFLPFGKLIDQWRWDVFSGKVPPERYNAAWWDLKRKYQGVAPPVARTESDFDPGAKYHIPANVPYTRYFLARILQFQFHRAMCQAAGFKGPLHECSIYGNKEAGRRLQAMLALGASKPWPDALEALTGQRTMDATAILDYYAPLRAWLETQNKGETCGW